MNKQVTEAPTQPLYETGFDLVSAVKDEILALDKSEGARRNIKSAFNRMIKAGLLDPDRLCVQMGKEWRSTKGVVKAHTIQTGRFLQWPSFLNDIRHCVNKIHDIDIHDLTFGDALLKLARRRFGRSITRKVIGRELSRDTGVNEHTAVNWMSGRRMPKPCSLDVIVKIDSLLEAEGRLLGKVAKTLTLEADSEPKKTYYQGVKWPERFEQEWAGLVAWRTNGVRPHGNMPLHQDISSRERRLMRLQGSMGWTVNASGMNHGDRNNKTKLRSFINFMSATQGSKFDADNLSISFLFDADMLDLYKADCISRGVYASCKSLFEFIRTEATYPSYSSCYYPPKEFEHLEQWKEELGVLCLELTNHIKDIEQISPDQDGKKNISWLLASENTSEMVSAIADELDRQALTYKPSNRSYYSHACTALLFRILLCCPLRKSNWRLLQWRERSALPTNGEPHLCFDAIEGHFYISVPKEHLKNRKCRTIGSIKQYLPSFLNQHIERFLKIRTTLIRQNGIEKSNYLFVPSRMPRNAVNTLKPVSITLAGPTSYTALGASFSSQTLKACRTLWPSLPIKKGFNPHAMRHLGATLFLKDNPQDYHALATLLNDSLEMVINTYAKRDDMGNARIILSWAEQKWGNAA